MNERIKYVDGELHLQCHKNHTRNPTVIELAGNGSGVWLTNTMHDRPGLEALREVIDAYLEDGDFRRFVPVQRGSFEPIAIKQPTSTFIDTVYEYQKKGDLDGGVDYIFSVLNSWLYKGEFNLADYVLAIIDEKKLESDLLLSFLTITRAARDKLPSRSKYIDRAFHRISQLRGHAVAKKLLCHMAD